MPRSEPAQFASTGHSLRGSTWVWLCAAGLSLGVAMAVSLLGLVSVKGVASLWPRPIEKIELREGSGTRSLTGMVIKEMETRVADGELQPQLLVYQGNSEFHADPYAYVKQADILSRKQPAGLMRIERLKGGPAFLYPVAIDTGRQRMEAGTAAYRNELHEMLREAAELRRRTLEIERRKMGVNSRALSELLIAERSGRLDAVEAEQRRRALQTEFEQLQAEVARLRARNAGVDWIGRDDTGRELRVPAQQMLGIFDSNGAGWWSRIGEMGRRFGAFLSESPRNQNLEGGVFPAIVGTVLLTLAMTLFVTPLGVIAAIYLSEYARKGPVVSLMRICVNNLAGVPSIVFGVFGLAFFVYFVGDGIDRSFFSEELEYLQKPTYGTPGILWASLTLALLTLPVVVVATEEALNAVPRGVRDAAAACGASKWQTIRRVVLPAARPGILTGVILAMARGAGEVAPLMLVGAVGLAQSLPVDDIAPYIHPERKFMHLGYHVYDLGVSSANHAAAQPLVYATALLLILVILLLNLAAILMRNRLLRRNPEGHLL